MNIVKYCGKPVKSHNAIKTDTCKKIHRKYNHYQHIAVHGCHGEPTIVESDSVLSLDSLYIFLPQRRR